MDKWIDVKEKMPSVGVQILMLIPTGIDYVCAGFLSERSLDDDEGSYSEVILADQYGDDIGYSVECMTHWMQIPELTKK